MHDGLSWRGYMITAIWTFLKHFIQIPNCSSRPRRPCWQRTGRPWRSIPYRRTRSWRSSRVTWRASMERPWRQGSRTWSSRHHRPTIHSTSRHCWMRYVYTKQMPDCLAQRRYRSWNELNTIRVGVVKQIYLHTIMIMHVLQLCRNAWLCGKLLKQWLFTLYCLVLPLFSSECNIALLPLVTHCVFYNALSY